MKDVTLTGRVLDIGAGGEGIIGQIAGNHVIGIAPEHLQEISFLHILLCYSLV
jgi:hypothetical protein